MILSSIFSHVKSLSKCSYGLELKIIFFIKKTKYKGKASSHCHYCIQEAKEHRSTEHPKPSVFASLVNSSRLQQHEQGKENCQVSSFNCFLRFSKDSQKIPFYFCSFFAPRTRCSASSSRWKGTFFAHFVKFSENFPLSLVHFLNFFTWNLVSIMYNFVSFYLIFKVLVDLQ